MTQCTTEQLRAIFRFKNESPSTVQTASLCEELQQALGSTVDEIVGSTTDEDCAACASSSYLDLQCDDRSIPIGEFSATDRFHLRVGWRQLRRAHRTGEVGAVWTVNWFPQYAGVLQAEQVGVDKVLLRVIALDNWGWTRHFLPSGDSVDSAVPASHVVLSCGYVPASLVSVFTAKLQVEITAAQHQGGTKRRANDGDGSLGHQKTPQFLVAAVRTAIDKTLGYDGDTHLPRGGMTDVGLHTGGAARDTCWPLVTAALRQALPPRSRLPDKVLLCFMISAVEGKLDDLVNIHFSEQATQVTGFWQQVDSTFEMLERVAERAAQAAEEGYACQAFAVVCDQARARLESIVEAWCNASAQEFALPCLEGSGAAAQYPSLHRPDLAAFETIPRSPVSDGAIAHQQAAKEFEFLDVMSCSLSQVDAFLGTIETNNVAKTLIGVRLVEDKLLALSEELENGELVAECGPELLLKVVTWYRTNCSPEKTHDSIKDLGMLVTLSWIATCLVHRTCAQKFSQLASHKIALDWSQLSVCVLRERRARIALLRVASYIQGHNTRATKEALFDLTKQDGTIQLARAMGQAIPAYDDVYRELQTKWRAQCDATWIAISSRKEQLVTVRREISECKDQLRSAEAELAEEEARLREEWREANSAPVLSRRGRWYYPRPPSYFSSTATRQLNGLISARSNYLSQKETKRDRLNRMPEFLVSPLPFEREDALEVLFLIAPPPEIDILAEFVWRAQRSLFTSSSTADAVHKPVGSVTWLQHFNDHRLGCSLPFGVNYVVAYGNRLVVPSSFGLSSADDVATQAAFEAANLWYPASSNTTIHWRDTSNKGAWTNPFLIGKSVSRAQFTPTLPLEGKYSWQWAIAYPDPEALQRGNTLYAQWSDVAKDTRSEEGPNEFNCRGALRAYPRQQLRRVYACVEADSLSWCDPIVDTIVDQALHQVGCIAMRETTLGFEWHQDLEDQMSLSGFVAAVNRLVQTLDHSPRRWKSIALVIKVAGFLCQYTQEAIACVQQLVAIARRWAEELSEQGRREGVSPSERDEFRTRSAILFGYAVLGFDIELGPTLSSDQAVELCELLVLFHNAKLFVASGDASVVECISDKVDRVMAARIAQVLAHLVAREDLGTLLTGLCCLTCASTPTHLVWHRVTVSSAERLSCCFAATDPATQTGYFLNLFSGAIVTDGQLPGGLPQSIKKMKTYRTLFGERDFEVVCSNRVYETTSRDTNHRLFRFRLAESSELRVEEAHPAYTLQLCTPQWHEQLSRVFPTQLGHLHSSWYWFERKLVLLREPVATSTAIKYAIAFDDAEGTARCYDVPREDGGLKYSEIADRLDQYPVFVVADAQLIKVFAKFEAAQFIHCTRVSSGATEVYLPRFGLRFQQDEQGRFASVGHREFHLSESQQLACGVMPRFRQYLVLEKEAERRLLIPQGSVCAPDKFSWVSITLPDIADASIPCSAMDLHWRLGVWVPDSIESRTQLAAIYCASGGRLSWKKLGMTGEEAAIRLLRGCSPPRLYSSVAVGHLEAIATLFAFRAPVTILIVALLLERSKRMSFLFGLSEADDQPPELPALAVANALDEYRFEQSTPRRALMCHRRQRLTLSEERDLLGSSLLHARNYGLQDKTVEVAGARYTPAVPRVTSVDVYHEQLQSLLTQRDGKPSANVPAFPLIQEQRNEMSECMIAEIRQSWNLFHESPAEWLLGVSTTELAVVVERIQKSVDTECVLLEHALHQIIDATHQSDRDQLLASVDRFARLDLIDIMQGVLDDDTLRGMAPCLSDSGLKLFKTTGLALLERHVLQDKLNRIKSLGTTSHLLVEELLCARSWDPREYPYWLIFEVEGGLQIRHEQYVIAQHLIKNPGSICQLNMGRGKTRVILPMLFLHFSHTKRGDASTAAITRAHFLTPLLSETREFMWRVLTSGVLALPFVELPFHRGFDLGEGELKVMKHCLDEAKRNGAIVMVAPEHRLSLELKRVEMGQAQDAESTAKLRILDSILDRAQYVDIFDESDALLHFGYHLVYANGASAPLDGGSVRWLVAQALLRVLASSKSHRVQQTLRRFPHLWTHQPEYETRRGSSSTGGIFNGIRLCLVSESSNSGDEDFARQLREALVEDLMDNAPFEMEWLRFTRTCSKSIQQSVIQVVTDVCVAVDDSMGELPLAITNAKQQLLALRGLLAFGVLENSLHKRYRVEYGHAPAKTRPKAIAIPYKAADLPTERSEFSHPDVAITLTLLAFYHSGLSDAQITRTFEVLLSLDPSERTRFYGEWFRSIASSIQDPREHEMLANLEHLSLDSPHQVAILCETYRYAIDVINFYVNCAVFPTDTRQFPQRMSRSAWDLVRGPTNIGFSGTKDTHLLLPPAVKQHEPDESELLGTNGKMIQLLLDTTRGYEPLNDLGGGQEREQSTACWQALLLLAIEKSCHAVIDTGALLAGVSNDAAAQFLMAQPGFTSLGVTYYDTRPQIDSWVVVEKDRNAVHFHKNSSLRECDTFVLFDEARTRGSDMKLLPEAVALLTLGPKLTKDKLMQGAGRLRQLGKHQQTLWLTSTSEVEHSIRRLMREATVRSLSGGFTVADVLNWVVDNTQRQCTFGLLEWADSGIQFTAKEADVENETQADDWTLEGQYASAQTEQLIDDIIQCKLQRTSLPATVTQLSTLLQRLSTHSSRFGRQDVVCVSSFGEECERELQVEEEQQEEREIVRHAVSPCHETAVKWQVLLDASSVSGLQATTRSLGAEIVSLERAMHQWVTPPECKGIVWGSTNIYATANFWSTVKSARSGTSTVPWTTFLRVVDAMVVFPDASVLLLSEREEDEVLAMLLRVRPASPSHRSGQFAFVHLPFVVGHLDRIDSLRSPVSIPASDVPLALGWDGGAGSIPHGVSIPLIAVLTCCLLNGDTDLFLEKHTEVVTPVLESLLHPLHHREQTLHQLISQRGFASRWKRSPLQQLTMRMDLQV